MLQVFRFRDTSNNLDFSDQRTTSRIWCALSMNNLKIAAVLQFAQLNFPSLHFKPLQPWSSLKWLETCAPPNPRSKDGTKVQSTRKTSMPREQGYTVPGALFSF